VSNFWLPVDVGFAYIFINRKLRLLIVCFCVLFLHSMIFFLLITNLNLCHHVYHIEVLLVLHEHENRWTFLNM
jgi:hypothetical protein